MPFLTSRLHDLAHNFATQVIEALRGASLQEITAVGHDHVPRNGKATRVVARGGGGGGQPDPLSTAPTKTSANGRLHRRSVEEIQAVLDKIVLLVKTQKDGLRAEEIRAKFGLQSKEMPRILKQGVASKVLRTKGQKRATTYFAK